MKRTDSKNKILRALLVAVLDKIGTFGMLTLCLPLFPNALSPHIREGVF